MTDRGFGKRDLAVSRAALVLENHRVEGSLHLDPAKRRFSDAWEALLRERRGFVPVTDVQLIPHDHPDRPTSLAFILVDKGDVQAAFPLDPVEANEAGNGHRPQGSQKISLEPVDVALLLNHLTVEGRMHMPPGVPRFSDGWERILGDGRAFIPLTDAKIAGHDGGHLLGEADFLIVDKHEVRAAYPTANGSNPAGARRIALEPLAARMQLDDLIVDGVVHVDRARAGFDRFSDQWETLMRDRREYIPVTDATIGSRDGGRVYGAADFLMLDKREIRAAQPRVEPTR
jgi:hypothetical protein